MTREELIERLEAATADQQATVLADAVRFARDAGWIDRERAAEAFNWIAYGAYESAALALVPAGCDWVVRSGMTDHPTDTRPYAHVMFGNVNRDRRRSLGEAHAATPALALCIAALKAQGGRA